MRLAVVLIIVAIANNTLLGHVASPDLSNGGKKSRCSISLHRWALGYKNLCHALLYKMEYLGNKTWKFKITNYMYVLKLPKFVCSIPVRHTNRRMYMYVAQYIT
jgi:hypothetical protein